MANHNSIYCVNCQQRTTLENQVRKPQESGDSFIYEIGECNFCQQHYLVLRRLQAGTVVELHPRALPKPVSPDLPASIGADLAEAYKCITVGAFRAALTMARRALQGIAVDKGAPTRREITKKSGEVVEVKNDLSRQIDWLFEQRIVTKELRDWAHEIRSVGNDGAHPADLENADEITAEDAEDITSLVEAFAQTLYVAPAIFRRRHSKEEIGT